MASEFTIESCIRGYHVYQERWTAVIGEVLSCRREPGNASDPFAVAVMKEREIVGHVPRYYSCICNLLLRKGGSLSCSITGNRRYSSDLPQGGLELPCSYRFSGSRKLIEKIKFRLIELDVAVTDTASSCDTNEKESVINPALGTESTEEKHTPVQILHSEDTGVQYPSVTEPPGTVWVQIKDIILSIEDRQSILNKQQLTDKHINGALRLIHEQFPAINGLVLTLLQNRPLHGSSANAIQIFHVRGGHWIVGATSNKGKVVTVYDSLYASLDQATAVMIQKFFHCSPCNIKLVPSQKQDGLVDCGLFAIANATAIAFGKSPRSLHYCQMQMREHLERCLSQKKLTLFPQLDN